jgi:hypothetical protein
VYTDFKACIDQYSADVHTTVRFFGSQWLTYLTDAGRSIKTDHEITDDNYGQAYKVLNERYDSKTCTAMHHIELLFNLRDVKSDSVPELRKLFEGFAEILAALNLRMLSQSISLGLILTKLDSGKPASSGN